jgi:hypothetical protein
MELLGYFLGKSDLPINTRGTSVEQSINFLNQSVDVNRRVTGKHFRQSIGETAMKAFARSLRKMQFKLKLALTVCIEFKTDIVNTFGRIAVQRIEKLIRPIFGEQLL